MTYDLYIGDHTFSSWSLRGWLMFERFSIPVQTHMVGLYEGTIQQDLAKLAPARLVPVMRCPDGTVVGDTLAMAETLAETLAERHPQAGLWPADPAARALARWMVAEMHSGFTALRTDCPMQLHSGYTDFSPSDAVRAFFAPVAARIAGYGLPVGDSAAAYVAQHLADPAFRHWRALGLRKRYDPMPYNLGRNDQGPTRGPWPDPKPDRPE